MKQKEQKVQHSAFVLSGELNRFLDLFVARCKAGENQNEAFDDLNKKWKDRCRTLRAKHQNILPSVDLAFQNGVASIWSLAGERQHINREVEIGEAWVWALVAASAVAVALLAMYMVAEVL